MKIQNILFQREEKKRKEDENKRLQAERIKESRERTEREVIPVKGYMYNARMKGKKQKKLLQKTLFHRNVLAALSGKTSTKF